MDFVRDVRPDLLVHVNTQLVLVGWGDRDFFGNPSKNVVTTMKAMLLPTSATIRLEEVSAEDLTARGTLETLEISDSETGHLAVVAGGKPAQTITLQTGRRWRIKNERRKRQAKSDERWCMVQGARTKAASLSRFRP